MATVRDRPRGRNLGPNPHLRARAALRRHLLSRRIDALTAEVLHTIDLDRFERDFVGNPSYSDECEEMTLRFLDIDRYARLAAQRFLVPGFDRLPKGSRVLDLGCGMGYFLVVCRHKGLEVTGLDLDPADWVDARLYRDALAFFGIDELHHTITPDEAVPTGTGQFDLVTAFYTTFNRLSGGDTWCGEQWDTFLTSLRPHVVTGGTVFMQLNPNYRLGTTYPPDVPVTIKRRDDFRAVFFADSVRLRAT